MTEVKQLLDSDRWLLFHLISVELNLSYGAIETIIEKKNYNEETVREDCPKDFK